MISLCFSIYSSFLHNKYSTMLFFISINRNWNPATNFGWQGFELMYNFLDVSDKLFSERVRSLLVWQLEARSHVGHQEACYMQAQSIQTALTCRIPQIHCECSCPSERKSYQWDSSDNVGLIIGISLTFSPVFHFLLNSKPANIIASERSYSPYSNRGIKEKCYHVFFFVLFLFSYIYISWTHLWIRSTGGSHS